MFRKRNIAIPLPSTTLNQGWVLELGTRDKISEGCPKTSHNLCYFMCTISGVASP